MDNSIISLTTARRYVLGRQGLWPSRRWSSLEGTATAIRQTETLQVDTINIVARSHDLALWSRVSDYQPSQLDKLLYTRRQFFDYGPILLIYPMDELPYWRTVMQLRANRLAEFMGEHSHTLDFVRHELKSRGPLGNRDFGARQRIPGGFNTVKDTGKALYYMWLAGELMTHSRRNFERVFDFTENIAPNIVAKDLAETQRFLALKAVRDLGLATSREWAKRFAIMLPRTVTPPATARYLDELTADGELATVRIAERKSFYYLPKADLPLLHSLEAGQIPLEWQTAGPNTHSQVNFLAPLDNVIWDRTRAQSLFDFDYVWEVYKPANIRKWGYYTLPILYGDKLVGRFSPKLDRKTATLQIEGFWLEADALAKDSQFLQALTNGLHAFAAFHHATKIEIAASVHFSELLAQVTSQFAPVISHLS